MGMVAVKPCGDTAIELEFTETAFEEIAVCVELSVVPVLVFAGALGWDNGLHSFG
jgi:hypothetical protein